MMEDEQAWEIVRRSDKWEDEIGGIKKEAWATAHVLQYDVKKLQDENSRLDALVNNLQTLLKNTEIKARHHEASIVGELGEISLALQQAIRKITGCWP